MYTSGAARARHSEARAFAGPCPQRARVAPCAPPCPCPTPSHVRHWAAQRRSNPVPWCVQGFKHSESFGTVRSVCIACLPLNPPRERLVLVPSPRARKMSVSDFFGERLARSFRQDTRLPSRQIKVKQNEM